MEQVCSMHDTASTHPLAALHLAVHLSLCSTTHPVTHANSGLQTTFPHAVKQVAFPETSQFDIKQGRPQQWAC